MASPRHAKRLNEMEEYVAKNRIMTDSLFTLQEVGSYLRYSRGRARQIENEALKKLKREITPRANLGT